MKLAIASGKGGTGKTTLSTNLAAFAAAHGRSAAYIDCDVEEPNGHLFLQPAVEQSVRATRNVPRVEASRCTSCGRCATFCRFNALARPGEGVLVFDELCHGCEGCRIVCPERAIRMEPKQIGTVRKGKARGAAFADGRLDVGEAMAAPLIRAVKQQMPAAGLAVLDSPPGASCSVVESVFGCDFLLLVTEPTPFGLNDLEIAVDLARQLDLPSGVVINRSDIGDDAVRTFCASAGVDVLAAIPDDRRIAEAYAAGRLAWEAAPQFAGRLETLLAAVEERVRV